MIASTLPGLLRTIAEAYPERVLLTDASRNDAPRDYLYAEAERSIDVVAGKVARLQAPAVGVLLSTSFECLTLVYGVLRAGKDVVLMDPQWGEAANSAIVRELSLAAVVGVPPSSSALQRIYVDIATERRAPEAPPEAVRAGKVLVFTSGTTSKPKGIILGQSALIAAYSLGRQCLSLTENIRTGCFYRVSGLGILGINFLFPIFMGGSAVILPPHSYASSDELWRLVSEHRINFLYLVPPVVSHLVKEGRPLCPPKKAGELLCVSASSRLDADVQQRFQASYAPLANIYGLTECGFAFLFGRPAEAGFDNSVGEAIGVQLQLRDTSGGTITTPFQRGRLCVRPVSLFDGYVNDAKLTSEVLCDGWLDTRDLAYFDERGGFFVLGRLDGTIKKGGNLFHLAECEELLHGLAQVTEATCIKIASTLYGEDYAAVIRPKDAAGAAFDYQAYLAHNLGPARAPRRVVITRNELPRNGAGKYDRDAIRQMVEG